MARVRRIEMTTESDHIYQEDKAGGLTRSFFLDQNPYCHHCGSRSSRILVAPDGWRPKRFYLCHTCYKKEMANRGEVIDRYSPTQVDPNQPYKMDLKTVWDSETGKARRGPHGQSDRDARKYGLGVFESRSYYQPEKQKSTSRDKGVKTCHYCERETARTGKLANGKTVPLCMDHQKQYDTSEKVSGEMSAPIYSKMWQRFKGEVLAEAKGRCSQCGGRAKSVDLHDPDIGWIKSNMMCICRRCNTQREKTAYYPTGAEVREQREREEAEMTRTKLPPPSRIRARLGMS